MTDERPTKGRASSNFAAGASAGRGTLEPLTTAELHQVERVGNRLLATLGLLFASLPESGRGASGMSRRLGVNRATCQRMCQALDCSDDAVEFVRQLPGAQGCASWVESFSGHLEQHAVSDARDACARFHDMVVTVARSKSRLDRRITLTRAGSRVEPKATAPVSDRQHTDARAAHFAASADLAGRWSECHVFSWFFRPAPSDPSCVEMMCGFVFHGHESRTVAVPFFLPTGMERDFEKQTDVFSVLGEEESPSPMCPPGVLEEFCTDPLPDITLRTSANIHGYFVDTHETSRGKSIDLALAQRLTKPMSHPAADDPPVQEVWYLSTFPARSLVLDVYLHPDLAKACLPSVSAHLLGPSMTTEADRWSTELPHRPPLRVLPRGIDDAATPRFSKYPEFLRVVLERGGWSSQDMIGFRCEVDYPIWRVAYLLAFRF
ncbi:MAG: hypothetical protein AAGB48_05100 [Planctomycetota bacterium]